MHSKNVSLYHNAKRLSSIVIERPALHDPVHEQNLQSDHYAAFINPLGILCQRFSAPPPKKNPAHLLSINLTHPSATSQRSHDLKLRAPCEGLPSSMPSILST